ncbi:MAG: AMP-binding protein [Pseudomonadota bacterium]
MTLLALLAGEDGDAVLAAPGGAATYADVRDTVRRAVLALGGARPVVATLLPDAPRTSLILLALCEAAVAAPLNPALTRAEQEAALARIGATALLAMEGDAEAAGLAEDLGLAMLWARPGAGHVADFSLTVSGALQDAPAAHALILSTSGSTGAPKAVPLTQHALKHSAQAIARTLDLGPEDCAAHMLPMFHVGAVVDLLLAPLSSGGRVCFAHPVATKSLVNAVTEGGATWLQGVPTMLTRLIQEDPRALPAVQGKLRFVRSVSADLAPETQREIEAALGAPVVQMYGMTETAGQIASNPAPPALGKPGSVGQAAGADIAILDRHANPLPQGQEGEVCVKGPGVMSGYLGLAPPDAFHGPYFRTGDAGYLDPDGFLFLTGRLKDVINRGGEKISPVEIERRALAHPDVLEAAAFALPHPSLGEEPGLAVVVTEDGGSDLEAWLADGLADFKRPRRVHRLAALPRLGSGKIDKRGLKAQVAGALDAGPARALTPLGRRVSRIWARTLNTAPPGPREDFFDAGGDSLAAVTFVMRLERVLGRPLPANLLYDNPEFDQFCAALDALEEGAEFVAEAPLKAQVRAAMATWQGRRAREDALFVGRNLAGTKHPLFFSAPSIDGAETFLATVGADRPLYLCRTLSALRGRFGRKLKTESATRTLAGYLAEEIEDLQPEGPVYLGGFCQGAVLMREVARCLEDAGRDIARLAIMERVFDEPVTQPALVAWTSEDWFSGAGNFAAPRASEALRFPAGAVFFQRDAGHFASYTGALAEEFGAFLARDIDGGAVLEPQLEGGMAGAAWETRREGHRARIHAKVPRVVIRGSAVEVSARVTNLSDTTWEAGRFLLQARWLNLDLHVRRSLAAHTRLSEDVAPGESAEVALSVPHPGKRLPLILVVDMVEDGLAWFHTSGSKPLRRLVWATPV